MLSLEEAAVDLHHTVSLREGFGLSLSEKNAHAELAATLLRLDDVLLLTLDDEEMSLMEVEADLQTAVSFIQETPNSPRRYSLGTKSISAGSQRRGGAGNGARARARGQRGGTRSGGRPVRQCQY